MTRNKDTTLVPVERITRSILVLRGHRVIIDRDLATIYGVETRTLNQAVKRNAERFPEDFRFSVDRRGSHGFKITICDLERRPGSEHQVFALCVHRTRRHPGRQRPELPARCNDGHPRRARVRATARDIGFQQGTRAKFTELERKVLSHDQTITGILKTIRELMNPPEPRKRPIGFVELQERKK